MGIRLGRGDLLAALGPFRDAWRRGDGQAAYHVVERDLALQPEEGAELLQQVQGHLLWQAYQSFFAVNSSRANAYAAIEQDTRLPRIEPSTTSAEFSRYRVNGSVSAFQPTR